MNENNLNMKLLFTAGGKDIAVDLDEARRLYFALGDLLGHPKQEVALKPPSGMISRTSSSDLNSAR